MSNEKQSSLKKIMAIRGMGAAITAFIGLIVIYVAFGLINPAVFSGQNIMNLLRSMSKYLLIGIAQSYILITGNIDLSIGSMVGMSAMVAATLMSRGVHPIAAIVVALLCCLVCDTGDHVHYERRGLHGKRQPQHGRHCHRNRQRGGGQLPEYFLLRLNAGCI